MAKINAAVYILREILVGEWYNLKLYQMRSKALALGGQDIYRRVFG